MKALSIIIVMLMVSVASADSGWNGVYEVNIIQPGAQYSTVGTSYKLFISDDQWGLIDMDSFTVADGKIEFEILQSGSVEYEYPFGCLNIIPNMHLYMSDEKIGTLTWSLMIVGQLSDLSWIELRRL